jgi:hypothetical protein
MPDSYDIKTLSGTIENPKIFAIVNGKETHQLAYDFTKKCWYTNATDKVKAFEDLLKRLDVIDLSDRPPQTQYSADEQKGIIEFLQRLFFLPPYFADQLEFPQQFSTSIRNHKKASRKLLTPLNDQISIRHFLKSLVENNSGILFLLYHDETSPYLSLSSCMKLLAEQGVKHIYDEAPIILIHGFNCFNETGKIEVLQEYIKKYELTLLDLEERFSLYQAAFQQGIQVFPVDMHITRELTVHEAMDMRNNIIIRNVEYFNQKLPEKTKYFLMFGAMHYAIANKDNLNIPSCFTVCIEAKPTPKEEKTHAAFFKPEQKAAKISDEKSNELSSSLAIEEKSDTKVKQLIKDTNVSLSKQLSSEEIGGMYKEGIDYQFRLPLTLSDTFLDQKAYKSIIPNYFKLSTTEASIDEVTKFSEAEIQVFKEKTIIKR